MKFPFIISIILVSAAGIHAQSFTNPLPITPGELEIPFNGMRAAGYYSYTAPENQLLTLNIPSADASLYATYTLTENPTSTDLPIISRRYPEVDLTSYRIMIPKDQTVYFKTSFLVWDAPESGRLYMNTEVEAVQYQAITTSDNPLHASLNQKVYLPLEIDEDALMKPVYISYTTTQYGFLSLDFQPSVTQIDYAVNPDEEFVYLKHEYIVEDGQTIGAKAFLTIEPQQEIRLRISGFSPAILYAEEIDPEPGSMCEFPLDIQSGDVTIPKDTESIFYRFKSSERGYLEINSPYSLPDGYVRVMMDCNGLNSFTIYDELSLRCFVWDNMEYLIEINRRDAVSEPQTFNLSVSPEQPVDSFLEGEPVLPGIEYSTPPFAGTYYYRLTSPDLIGSTLKLETAEMPVDSRTRVNLYNTDNSFDSLARGLNLEYVVEPETSYILQFTVFDNRHSLPFSFTFEGGVSSVEPDIIHTPVCEAAEGGIMCRGKAEIFTPEGKLAGINIRTKERFIPLTPGLYICKTETGVYKVIVK